MLEHGFFEATLDQICTRAKISKGSLYHHYDSKEQLAVAVYLEAFASLQATLYVTFRIEPRDGIERIVGGYLDWFAKNVERGTYLIRAPEWNHLAPIAIPIRDEEERVQEHTRAWFGRLIRRRVFRKVPDALYEPLVLGPTREFLRRWIDRPRVSDLKEARPLLIDAAWNAIAVTERR